MKVKMSILSTRMHWIRDFPSACFKPLGPPRRRHRERSTMSIYISVVNVPFFRVFLDFEDYFLGRRNTVFLSLFYILSRAPRRSHDDRTFALISTCKYLIT